MMRKNGWSEVQGNGNSKGGIRSEGRRQEMAYSRSGLESIDGAVVVQGMRACALVLDLTKTGDRVVKLVLRSERHGMPWTRRRSWRAHSCYEEGRVVLLLKRDST